MTDKKNTERHAIGEEYVARSSSGLLYADDEKKTYNERIFIVDKLISLLNTVHSL